MKATLMLCTLLVSVSGFASLMNVGDKEVYVLDASVNYGPKYGGVPVLIPFTAGEYELSFWIRIRN